MDTIKENLLIDFSNHFAENHDLAPLTAKIYSYILLSCRKEGVTFDELIETFCASKSSVSNSLNFLTKLKYVEHFNKIDQRKRYYKVSPDSLLVRLEKVHKMLTQEKLLSERLKSYRLEKLTIKDDLAVEKAGIYLNHIENALNEIFITIQKLSELKLKNI